MLLAIRCGVSPERLGIRPEGVLSGARTGLVSAGSLAAAIAVAVAVPATRPPFLKERVALAGGVPFQVLVRIPLGTALAEELIFRAALLGLFLRRHEGVTAAALSSAVFGLWHLTPGLAQLRTDASGDLPGDGRLQRPTAVIGTVLATAAAGFAFALLRLSSGSVLAPSMAHAAANAFAFLGGRLASRLTA